MHGAVMCGQAGAGDGERERQEERKIARRIRIWHVKAVQDIRFQTMRGLVVTLRRQDSPRGMHRRWRGKGRCEASS